MSILNPTSNPAKTAADQVRNIVRQQFLQLARSGVQGFNLIWNNPAASASDIVTQLSTDAAAVFQLAQLNIATVQSAAAIGGTTPPTIPSVPPGNVISFNSDGTAVVTTTQSTTSSVALHQTKAA